MQISVPASIRDEGLYLLKGPVCRQKRLAAADPNLPGQWAQSHQTGIKGGRPAWLYWRDRSTTQRSIIVLPAPGVAASRAARDAFCHDQRTTSVMLTARNANLAFMRIGAPRSEPILVGPSLPS